MGKKTGGKGSGLTTAEFLFAELEERKRRKLFLPKLLENLSSDTKGFHLGGPQRDKAHAIVIKWADMESAGQLDQKETALDADFLSEVFGEALGYRGTTENTDRWELERQFGVPSVGNADGALGQFSRQAPPVPLVMIELKGRRTNLDKDKSNGRTAVQQLWDYMNAVESCRWGIVSNFSTIRLYHRDKTPQAYERFTLQELRDPDRFAQFYWIFERNGLVQGLFKQPPRAVQLLENSQTRQAEVGDKLYNFYSDNRLRLIEYLHKDQKVSLDSAIRIAQKLLDRIIFMAFCEDRALLPDNLIDRAYRDVPFLARITNPRWQNFLALFHAVDKGHPEIGVDHGYNGGLFAHDPLVDDLQLPDEPWTTFFKSISDYDYRDEVSVTVLGHLFEKSITELERLRTGGLFGGNGTQANQPQMLKSAQRKRLGTYYTPPDFTRAIVRYAVDELVEQRFADLRTKHKLTDKQLERTTPTPALRNYWRDGLDNLRQLKIVDPACGSGAFLIEAYEALRFHYESVLAELAYQKDPQASQWADAVPDMILAENLYGVDLSPEAVEITQLSLWIASARKGKTLANLSKNIIVGNSLVTDPAIHPAAFDWEQKFPDVFNRSDPTRRGFDCVIGNPPWERLKLQEREFFSLNAPQIASAVSAATRRKLIVQLEKDNPDLFQRYQQAIANADATLTHVRASGAFPLTGKGDINTYMLFAELGRKIVAPTGRVGLLVPSGITTDMTTAEFFNALMDGQSLIRLYDFENRNRVFADVDSRFKFSILIFGGSGIKTPAADFVFFAHDMRDLLDRHRHIELSAADMKRMNPNTQTCPVFRSKRDAELTKAIYGRVPVLIDHNRKSGGNPWSIKFATMFHQTNDAEKFLEPAALKGQGFKLEGNRWRKGKKVCLPLYEAKMIQAFDHRAASVEVAAGNWMRQGQTVKPALVDLQNPEHPAMPRWWVKDEEVSQAVDTKFQWFLGFKDITSPTNTRTMIAAMIPRSGVTNHFPLILSERSPRLQCCLLANLNSHIFDYVARQKIGGVTLNFFIVEQLPTLPPDVYADKCPWDKKQSLEKWISERVLKLTCTAHDMRPLAEACGFAAPDYWHKWKPAEREQLRAELDAAYFHLYGLKREDVVDVLGTFAGTRQDDEEPGLLETADSESQEAGDDLAQAGQLILKAYDDLGS